MSIVQGPRQNETIIGERPDGDFRLRVSVVQVEAGRERIELRAWKRGADGSLAPTKHFFYISPSNLPWLRSALEAAERATAVPR